MSDNAKPPADSAAHDLVQWTFLHLGIDPDDPASLGELRRDLAHLRVWRESTETVRKGGLVAAVTFVTAGLLGLIWISVRGG